MYKVKDAVAHTPFSMEAYDRYFRGLKVGFFDIETTGLNPAGTSLILSGFSVPENGRLRITQFLAENPRQEREVLASTLEELGRLDAAVTYNGRKFDIPFFLERCRRNGISADILPYDLDLYQVIEKGSSLRSLLPNLRQKTVEDYMGLWRSRSDRISGRESIDLYLDFSSTGSAQARDKVLLHNRDDVCQLARLMKVLMKCDFDKAMFLLGFPCRGMTVTKISLKRGMLIIEGTQGRDASNHIFYDDFASGVRAEMSMEKRTFIIQAPVISKNGYVLADLRLLGIDSGAFRDSEDDLLLLRGADEMHYKNINMLASAVVGIVRLRTG